MKAFLAILMAAVFATHVAALLTKRTPIPLAHSASTFSTMIKQADSPPAITLAPRHHSKHSKPDVRTIWPYIDDRTMSYATTNSEGAAVGNFLQDFSSSSWVRAMEDEEWRKESADMQFYGTTCVEDGCRIADYAGKRAVATPTPTPTPVITLAPRHHSTHSKPNVSTIYPFIDDKTVEWATRNSEGVIFGIHLTSLAAEDWVKDMDEQAWLEESEDMKFYGSTCVEEGVIFGLHLTTLAEEDWVKNMEYEAHIEQSADMKFYGSTCVEDECRVAKRAAATPTITTASF
ncbi:hypothetical protein LTR08_008264 [Meristemomyces frigidus]|nr:hypothetical protein LTR08_008264 [Meristemomyces frigidus]